MGNKERIIRECERLNFPRKVSFGKIGYMDFFRGIHGCLLISGWGAEAVGMAADYVCSCFMKDHLPTIVLSCRDELLCMLQDRIRAGELDRTIVSCPSERNYHPFYGMTPQQILMFIRMTADELGYDVMLDRVMVYASALLNVVAAKYPVSLPAMSGLLAEDDDYISELAVSLGLSNIVAENIAGNHEAGIVLRRICERLEEIFESVYESGTDTHYSFQSGAKGNVAVMALYPLSSNQTIMNSYLKEELYFTLKRVPAVRVVLNEMAFDSEEDVLLKFLLQMKRQGKIELTVISRNAKAALPGAALDFENILMFQHDNVSATEELSKELFGNYWHHAPAPVVGRPPAVLFTLKRSVHWQIDKEERLRVRAVDMYGRQSLFGKASEYAAVRTTANSSIFLIPTDVLMADSAGYDLVPAGRTAM